VAAFGCEDAPPSVSLTVTSGYVICSAVRSVASAADL